MTKKIDRQIVIRVLCVASVVLWMAVIFMFSANDGDTSSVQSDKVSYMFTAAFGRAFGLGLSQLQMGSFSEALTFMVRKTAHFMEYFILGVLLYPTVSINLPDRIRMRGRGRVNLRYIVSLAIVFLYACSDEIHQYFVPGRFSSFKDVLIDTAGGLTGLLIIALIRYIHGRKAYNKSKESVRSADDENM